MVSQAWEHAEFGYCRDEVEKSRNETAVRRPGREKPPKTLNTARDRQKAQNSMPKLSSEINHWLSPNVK